MRRPDLKHVQNVTVINSEECAPQHKLLVSDINVSSVKLKTKPLPPKRRIWKLNDPSILEEYLSQVDEALNNLTPTDSVEQAWLDVRDTILNSIDTSCGWTKSGNVPRETWWWNDTVDSAIKEKRRLWKAWKMGGSKEEYLAAKRSAKSAVYEAKKNSAEEKFSNLQGDREKLNYVFKSARKLNRENQDIVGDKCVKDDEGNIAYDDEAKLEAWRQHYQRLLNVEFEWSEDDLSEVSPVEGAPPFITFSMVLKAIARMKQGKAAGPSGVVIEMIKAAGDRIVPLISHLLNLIIKESKVPDEWNLSYIINLYKGKGDGMDRGNFRGLKLLDQVMKIGEHVLEVMIRSQVTIDGMQFGFVPFVGTTDAIFIVRQLQEKYLNKHKDLYFAFVDLEKAFDRIPRKVVWWAMRKLGVEEWLVKVVQAMYEFPRSSVRVNGNFSKEFPVKVGVHQGSVLSPLLFIIVMEALSREFRVGCPWELLYADDLVIAAETLEELKSKLQLWKQNLEAKGLRVNMGKTKILHSHYGDNQRTNTGDFPCGVCRKGVGSNSIKCSSCKLWVHKRCSGVAKKLKEDPNFKCKTCQSDSHISQDPDKVALGEDELDMVLMFCYLGDMLGNNGGCADATTTRVRSAWKKFRDLLPILSNPAISLKVRGHVFSAAVRGVLLHASETWPLTVDDDARLLRNDHSMIRWICGKRLCEGLSLNELHNKLGIPSLHTVLRRKRLAWYGHVMRMDGELWQNNILSYDVGGAAPLGRPKKRWLDCVNQDMRTLKISTALTSDRAKWRSSICK